MNSPASSIKNARRVDLIVILSAILFSIAIIVYADTSSTQVIVGNSTPSLSSTTFNNSSDITLTENTTTAIYATTTVTDANGCGTIVAVMADFYRSDITETNCDESSEAVNNYCYPDVTCTVASGTCSGGADTTADYVCTINMQYYADATDAGSTYAATNWSVTFEAGDGTASSTESTASVEVNTLLSLNVDASLDYGTLSANTDSGATNSTTTVTNTGNENMDPELSGTTMTSGGDTIAIANQEYASAPFTYTAGTDLSASATQINLALPKPYSTTSPVTADISWGLGIDAGQPNGTYTGTNTIGAAAGI